jgi:hypothetical protein
MVGIGPGYAGDHGRFDSSDPVSEAESEESEELEESDDDEDDPPVKSIITRGCGCS